MASAIASAKVTAKATAMAKVALSMRPGSQRAGAGGAGPAEAPFAGRSVLVTGGSRGLGLLIACEMAEQGARLLLCARDQAELLRAAERVRCHGGEVRILVGDLTDPDFPERLVALAHRHYGGIDVVVNNAGVIEVGPFEVATEEDFRAAMETMFFAPLRLILAVLPQMRARHSGTIIDVTSVGGRIAAPHLLPYAAAKFAATGLSEGLRAELAEDGVSVTTVVPGLMRTGSHGAAHFSGQADQEYAWFAAAASLPLVSIDAARAAKAIVRAAGRRRPEVVLSIAAKAAVRAHGLAPATTTRLLTLADRLLPDAADGENSRDVPGVEAARRLGGRAMSLITTLGDRAARRNNEPTRPAADSA